MEKEKVRERERALSLYLEGPTNSSTEEPRSKASVNSVIRSIRHVFKSPNFFLFFSLVKHSANKAFGNKANRAIRHDFFSPEVVLKREKALS